MAYISHDTPKRIDIIVFLEYRSRQHSKIDPLVGVTVDDFSKLGLNLELDASALDLAHILVLYNIVKEKVGHDLGHGVLRQIACNGGLPWAKRSPFGLRFWRRTLCARSRGSFVGSNFVCAGNRFVCSRHRTLLFGGGMTAMTVDLYGRVAGRMDGFVEDKVGLLQCGASGGLLGPGRWAIVCSPLD